MLVDCNNVSNVETGLKLSDKVRLKMKTNSRIS